MRRLLLMMAVLAACSQLGGLLPGPAHAQGGRPEAGQAREGQVPAASAVAADERRPPQRPLGAAAEEGVCAIGHTIYDLDTLISGQSEPAGSETVPSDVRVQIRALPAGRNDIAQNFTLLHRERRWAIDEQRRLSAEMLRLAANPEPPTPVDPLTPLEYEKRSKEIEDDIKKNEEIQNAPQEKYSDDVKGSAGAALLSLTRKRAVLEAASLEQARYDSAARIYRNTKSTLRCDDEKFMRIGDYLNTLDDVINSNLLTTDATNKFRLYVCIAFSILIGLVIAGFFMVSYLSESIRNAIFTGESALQFVTLFSLIIAIILFGIVNILEGRELSALLGGLSGYILGRGNAQLSGSRSARPAAPDQAGAKAPT